MQKIAEGRLARERQRAHDLVLQETAKILTNQVEKKQKCLERHILRIREDILNTHCPHCDLVFSDWDACMAVQHSSEDIHGHQYGCMRYFCGWCMAKCESNSQCHEHVKRCPMSKEPGSYYGREDQYKQVHATMKKEKLNKYFDIHMNPECNNDNNNHDSNDNDLFSTKPNTYNCFCGCYNIESDWIFCNLCMKYRHTSCCGYENVNALDMPNYFVCYACITTQLVTLPDNSDCRPLGGSLIVIPATLISQWQDQFDYHMDNNKRLKVIIYQSQTKNPNQKNLDIQIQKH